MNREINIQLGVKNSSAELTSTERDAVSIEERMIEKNRIKKITGEVIRIKKGDKIYKAWQENRERCSLRKVMMPELYFSIMVISEC